MVLKVATVEDFVGLFGQMESIEISNLEDASEGSINEVKIQRALDIAYDFIMSYDSLCQYSGKVAIRRAIRRLMLDMSRYFLDVLQRREDVIKSHEDCVDFLKMCVDNKDGWTLLSQEEADELGLELKQDKVSYVSGRRVFTDSSLSEFRKQKLYYR